MNSPPGTIGVGEALRFWLRLGFISFGGPAGQIAILHQELVERRRWISERRFLHALNYCMVLPGPEALQLAIYLGWLFHRSWGGVAAGLLFVLPSLALLIGLSWIYLAFGHLAWVAGLFYGIKPAVVAIVIQATLRIGGRVLRNASLWTIAVAAFLALFVGGIPFPAIIGCAALCGFLGARWRPDHFRPTAAHRAANTTLLPALIDDQTPPPAHACFRWSRLASTLGMGMLLWLAPLLGLYLQFGERGALTQMAWFFTKAALLTFGGAYAVLPYVFQGAVAGHGWLTPLQMIDGLALGETTPGPLIIVVAFVGFVGAWTQAAFGPDQLFLAGAAGACVVSWFTFLPSFVLVLAGGPLIESTHDDLKFTAPLTGISAAVAGVIVNLALFFAWHVLWPDGRAGAFDSWAALLMVGATLALLRARRSVIEVILAGAALGLVLRTVLPLVGVLP